MRILMILMLAIIPLFAVGESNRRASLDVGSIICMAEKDIYNLIDLYQKGDMGSIEKYMRPEKCAMLSKRIGVVVIDHVPGRPWALVVADNGLRIYTFSQGVIF